MVRPDRIVSEAVFQRPLLDATVAAPPHVDRRRVSQTLGSGYERGLARPERCEAGELLEGAASGDGRAALLVVITAVVTGLTGLFGPDHHVGDAGRDGCSHPDGQQRPENEAQRMTCG
jgi:hypothetical protein